MNRGKAKKSCYMHRLIFSMVLAALLTFTAGCQLPAAAVSDNPVGEDAYSVTDIQGTKVNMPGKPHRILTLSMSTDEVVLGLVRPDHMAAVNSLLDDPVSSNVVDLAAQVEGRVKDPTVEEIAAMEPDLVIVPDWGDIAKVAALRDLGLHVVVCQGAKNLTEIKETIRLIAQAVGEPQRGEVLLQKMDERLNWVQSRTMTIPAADRKTVVLISLMKSYGGIGCSFDDACQYAGVTNGMAKIGIHNGQTMSKEQLVEINPDILFLPTYTNHGAYDSGKFRATYLDDPSLQSVQAIRDQALREPFEGYIYNCSQDYVLGVQEIAYCVYGDEFRQSHKEHLTAVDE